MKTQLLEDIGENAPLSLTPPGKVGHSTTDKAVPKVPPARSAPSIAETQQPEQAAAPDLNLDLDSVFEEIAALEAQYVAPATNPEPVLAPAEPARPASQEAPLHEPAAAPAGSMPGADPAPGATVPRDPVFDFTLPSPEPHASELFTPAPTWPARKKRRTLLWSTGLLSAALLIGGGWWLYEEHSLAGSLALVANGAREALPVNRAVERAVERPTIVSKRLDASPAGDAPAAPAAPAAPVGSPAPAVPPLVMLEPESPAAARAEQSPPAPAPAEQAEPGTTSRPEADAERTSAFPLPKSLSRAARGEADGAAQPPPRKVKPEPVRRVARASTVQPDAPSADEGPMSALLRACREHGYHAAQCVKQGCSLTQYGFACRGR